MKNNRKISFIIIISAILISSILFPISISIKFNDTYEIKANY